MTLNPGYEVNFDGIVGPTHNYSGLSLGNVASMSSKGDVSNPKAAALQGLEKMKFLADKGVRQAVLPPHERPFIPLLRELGFTGVDRQIPGKVYKEMPELLFQCSSASAMWTANAATITPSIDSADNHLQITPANLTSKFHRSIETEVTARILQKVFSNSVFFTNHHPLPIGGDVFADEGAANHSRFCNMHKGAGVHLFVYGRRSMTETYAMPKKFPARHTFEASQAIARSHQQYPERTVFAQQHPKAIDEGVFHNDVISVSNCQLFFYHEYAFVNTERVVEEIRQKVEHYCDIPMVLIDVPETRISLFQAVNTYLFNSQIVTLPDGAMLMIAPTECQNYVNVRQFLDEMIRNPENPIREIHYFNLRESMRNGGGPACLRLRVVLTQTELEAMHQKILLTDRLYVQLVDWVSKHYRDRLEPNDLADPALVDETRLALDELTKILELGSIYDFQRMQE